TSSSTGSTRSSRPGRTSTPPTPVGPRRGSGGVAADELEDAAPRVLRRLGVVLLAPVEEAVRRTVVGDDLVLDTRLRERLVEGGVVGGRDVAVVSRLEGEDRRFDLRGTLQWPGELPSS